MRLQGEVKLDEALWLPGSLCGLFRIPFYRLAVARRAQADGDQRQLPTVSSARAIAMRCSSPRSFASGSTGNSCE
ncbi:MAG: hypothetical protein IPJ48_14095 [Propionivibrio sp.]|uniref:Uncharacterized protein n=1 Tax=Candidatus Propionivibrio dominans TaxID=2954373 RepID=A0A9D7I8B2_9RHOO|nr:hypothetical protein [Candidatus Propionivibrio dominans]MBL0166698.1 hypothetical protein [Propionivibrio sp.]